MPPCSMPKKHYSIDLIKAKSMKHVDIEKIRAIFYFSIEIWPMELCPGLNPAWLETRHYY